VLKALPQGSVSREPTALNETSVWFLAQALKTQ